MARRKPRPTPTIDLSNIWQNCIVENGCRVWTGSKTDGYGMVETESGRFLVHRLVWTAIYGDPGDLLVLHRCDNRPCTTPTHLFLGTNDDNMKDMKSKGRSNSGNRIKTHCKKGHPLSGDNLRINPNGSRQCRACHAERQREYRKKARK